MNESINQSISRSIKKFPSFHGTLWFFTVFTKALLRGPE